MKKKSSFPIVFVVAVVISISVPAPAAFAWDAATHALIAREGEKLPYGGYVCGYWARTGAVAVDFAWHLQDFRGFEGAADLHDKFLEYLDACTSDRNYRHRCFKYGAETHLCADVIADESINTWLASFPGGVAEEDEQAFHLAFEFAVGSLIDRLQLADLIFLYRPAGLVECVVSRFLGTTPPFDVRGEFKIYMALMRMLEKVSKIYAPYLRGEVGEEFLDQINVSDLLPESLELSDGALSVYLEVMSILLTYPAEIRHTISCCPNWEDVVAEAKTTCPID